MISIIVSSCDSQLLNQLKASVGNTIGVTFEFVVIENAKGRLSLTQAYNLGASKAAYSCLLFLHEDVIFRTENWGNRLLKHLNDLDNVGIVGVIGSDYKSAVPSGWSSGRDEVESYNLIQGYKHRKSIAEHRENRGGEIRPVICVDGVFMAVRKDVYELTGFDNSVSGFHAYDLDFSLNVAQSFQNYFVPDILIEHLSEGKITDEWLENVLHVSEKWKQNLPLSVGDRKIDVETELSAFSIFLDSLFSSTLSNSRKTIYATRITLDALSRTRSFGILSVLAHALSKGFRK